MVENSKKIPPIFKWQEPPFSVFLKFFYIFSEKLVETLKIRNLLKPMIREQLSS